MSESAFVMPGVRPTSLSTPVIRCSAGSAAACAIAHASRALSSRASIVRCARSWPSRIRVQLRSWNSGSRSMSLFFAFSIESRCAEWAAFSIAEDMNSEPKTASRSRVVSDSACSFASAGSTSPYSFCRAASPAIHAASSCSFFSFCARMPPFTRPSSMPLRFVSVLLRPRSRPAALICSSLLVFPSASRMSICSWKVRITRGKRPLGRLLDLGVGLVALRAPRVADHEDEVAFRHARRLDRQPARRLVGNVLLRERRRLAVLADVGAIEGPVARVPRPAPVVGLAAEVADAGGRGVDEAHVLDLQLRDLEVLQPAEEGVHRAAVAARLAGRDALLDPPLDEVEALAVVELRVELARDRVRHVLHGDGHEHARARPVRQLLVAGLREVAVDEQVLLRGRVELQRALDAVVVGDDQAVGRDERGRAAAERDDRAHRLAGEVGEGGRVALEAHGLELRGEVRDLLGHPHALVGDEGGGDDQRCRENQDGADGGVFMESPRSAPRGRDG